MIITILILIFCMTIASTWWFGLWSNLITLVNLLLSAMAASSFYLNVASFLQDKTPTFAMLLPFMALWLVFALTFFILRGITDTLSSMRLRFDFLTEMIGRSLLSISIAWVFVCFTMFALQLAPLPPNWLTSNGVGPDNLWVSFIRSRSVGSLAASREEGIFPADKREFMVNNKPLELESRMFDPANLFFSDANLMRKDISQQKTLRIPVGQ